MLIYAYFADSHLRHQYGIFGGKSQTSFSRNATRAGSEEGWLFSQAKIYFDGLHFGRQGRDITWFNSSLFCTRQCSRRCNQDVNRKSFTMHLLICHPLHVKCLQYDNATSNSKKQYERKSFNYDRGF